LCLHWSYGWGDLAVKFIVVEIDDGGAQQWEWTGEKVAEYLMANQYWRQAGLKFAQQIAWVPGMAMSYPRGWVFCVHDDVRL
jgi:hypothetical protein